MCDNKDAESITESRGNSDRRSERTVCPADLFRIGKSGDRNMVDEIREKIQCMQAPEKGGSGDAAAEDAAAELKDKMEHSRPEQWDRIPDIDLYMDQLKSYMERQHIGFELSGTDETLTSSMVNNYIKSGIMPRAKGKRYNRTHIGILTAICLLKQVLKVDEVGKLLGACLKGRDVQSFYNDFSEILDEEYGRTAEMIDPEADAEETMKQALQMAVSGYAQILACKTLLKTIPDEEPEK
jgi:hypothetical protein